MTCTFSWYWTRGQSCGTESLTCGIGCCLLVDTIRTELNLWNIQSVSAKNWRIDLGYTTKHLFIQTNKQTTPPTFLLVTNAVGGGMKVLQTLLRTPIPVVGPSLSWPGPFLAHQPDSKAGGSMTHNSVSLGGKLCIYFWAVSILWFQKSRYVGNMLESPWVSNCDVSQKLRNRGSHGLTLSFPGLLEKLPHARVLEFLMTFMVVSGNGHLVANAFNKCLIPDRSQVVM